MTIDLRPAEDTDTPFLKKLFELWKAEDFGMAKIDAVSFGMLMDIQWLAYSRAAAARALDCSIIVVDGKTIGQLTVQRRSGRIHITEIALMPEWRGKGVGEQLLRRCQEEARAAGLDLTLQVASHNRARSLYGRLGFTLAEDKGTDLVLRWRPEASALAS